MDFLSFFLGQSENISYDSKQIEVWRLRGASGVYRDESGQIYIQRWVPEGELGKTPGQRARKVWKPNERHFSCYPEGVTSAGRGLRLARAGAEKKYIPTFQKISEIFEDEVRGSIIFQPFFNWDGGALKQDLKEEILKTGFIFSRARKPDLRESFVQLYFLIVDAQGKVNVGAALARVVAITDRVRERLRSIYAWLAVFSGREQGLAVIDREFKQLSKKLGHQVKLWLRHQAIARASTSDLQRKLLNDKVAAASRNLQPFVMLKPFDRWVSFTIDDLKQTTQAIKKSDYPIAKAMLKRVEVALEVKKEQWVMDTFLEKIQNDAILYRRDWELYRYQLGVLQRKFELLAIKENNVGFVEPVCGWVAYYLSDAVGRLKERKLPKIIELIKEAYQLL